MRFQARALAVGLMLVLGGCVQAPGAPIAERAAGSPEVTAYRVQQLRPRPQTTILDRYRDIRPYDLAPGLESMLKGWRGRTRAWLTRDPGLDAAARTHSRQMAIRRTGFLVSPDGTTLEDRMKANGVTYGWWAGYAWGAQEIDDFYTVPIHILKNFDRSYVTNDSVKRYGIGVYRRGNKAYATLLFTD